MAASLPQQDMLDQVNQLWSMLDDMSQTDPESYQKFIKRHLQEGVEQCAPPAPHTCLETRILDPEEGVLYINLCGWSRVPAPKSDSEPVPLSAGKLEQVDEGNERYKLMNVAYNPKVLKRGEEDGIEMDQLIRLAMKYIEQEYQLRLTHSYKLASYKLKGCATRMKQSLAGPAKTKPQTAESGGSLLQQISCLRVKGEPESSPSIELFTEKGSKPRKAGFIEVLSSTELEPAPVQTPSYHLSVSKDENGRATRIQLNVHLPEASSVSECDLGISQDDVLIEVPDRYRLHLNLPESVHEEAVTAKFSRRSRVLCVTMPVL
ncbi:PIHD2 protein, partial [Polyodon spathula]|nr:PIHD2 protein [Polyodon spathula]